MNRTSKNRMPVTVFLVQLSLGCGLCMLLAAECPTNPILDNDNDNSSNENSNDTDGLIDAKIFEAVMRVESYDTSDPESPQYASVGTLFFATFPVDPLAVSYTVDFVRTDYEGGNFSGTWRQNEYIANVFAITPGLIERNIWPGYDAGIVGGEYYVKLIGGGCQGGADGDCKVGTPSTIEKEDVLREVRRHSTVTVTIEYE